MTRVLISIRNSCESESPSSLATILSGSNSGRLKFILEIFNFSVLILSTLSVTDNWQRRSIAETEGSILNMVFNIGGTLPLSFS